MEHRAGYVTNLSRAVFLFHGVVFPDYGRRGRHRNTSEYGYTASVFLNCYMSIVGRIILRWIFRKLERVVGTGWSRLRIGTGGGHL
jgi:hypothetical protein